MKKSMSEDLKDYLGEAVKARAEFGDSFKERVGRPRSGRCDSGKRRGYKWMI